MSAYTDIRAASKGFIITSPAEYATCYDDSFAVTGK